MRILAVILLALTAVACNPLEGEVSEAEVATLSAADGYPVVQLAPIYVTVSRESGEALN